MYHHLQIRVDPRMNTYLFAVGRVAMIGFDFSVTVLLLLDMYKYFAKKSVNEK
jgi:hypothetical protein